MFGKSAFGTNTGGFGQQPQQNNSVFGQQPQQQQQNNAFGGFGAANNTGAFGAPNNNSAFGQPAQQSAFGAPAANTGFGATTSAFGQPKPAGFGGGFGATGTSAFGSAQPAANTGFGGGFGANTGANNSAFGAGANNTGGGMFGQRPATGAFGNTPTAGAFGQPQQQTSAFGGGGGFGNATGSAFGQPAGATNQGTAGADFAPTQDRDLTTGANNFFQTITAMPQYKEFSLEELRLQDYNQGRKTGASAGGAFGQPAAVSAFGQPAASGGAFGQPAQNNSLFGQPAQTGGAFGQPAQNNAFGAANNNTGGIFGQQTGTSAFGQNNGASAFGQPAQNNTFGAGANTANTGFGAGATGGGFGANAGANKPFGFGNTSTPTTGFGATGTNGFGQQANTGGFGQQPAQAGGFGNFGAKPATAAPTTGFGGFGNAGAAAGGFGAATSKPAASFGFGQTPATSTGTTGFGFGAQNNTAGTFGQPAAGAAGGGLFGGAKPATSTAPLFGAGAGAATGTTGFGGFGVGQNNTSAGFGTANTGGLFGQKPATGTGGGLFGGGNTLGGSTFSGFGQQQQNTGSFNLPAQGGLTSFGTNGLPNQQQPLVAAVDRNPYGSNPLFDLTKPPGASSDPRSGPSAVAVSGSASKPPTPHYPISPRVVSKIKLRGFSVTPVIRPTKKKMSSSSIEGVSDDAVLGAGAFAPRENNRQLIFDDSVDPANIVAIVNKKAEKKKVLFDPNLEYVASRGINNAVSSVPPTATENGVSGVPIATSSAGSSSSSSAAIKRGYYMSPTIETLKGMSKENLKVVHNFTVGRKGFGEIRFEKSVDLSEVDLDDLLGTLILIEDKKVVVYPDESSKKSAGVELNVPALIKIENCFPRDKNTGAAIKDPEHPRFLLFVDKLRQRPNINFVDYDYSTGTWSFKTERF
ncbi:nucleoporin autopeptidase-domain-containing protein [Sporodiniella umbellata]|nr:nucleoporin autopeptidase-domain-containing protein [Sporodiniella umbellata]